MRKTLKKLQKNEKEKSRNFSCVFVPLIRTEGKHKEGKCTVKVARCLTVAHTMVPLAQSRHRKNKALWKAENSVLN